jgi:hypothetical protein
VTLYPSPLNFPIFKVEQDLLDKWREEREREIQADRERAVDCDFKVHDENVGLFD